MQLLKVQNVSLSTKISSCSIFNRRLVVVFRRHQVAALGCGWILELRQKAKCQRKGLFIAQNVVVTATTTTTITNDHVASRTEGNPVISTGQKKHNYKS